MKQGTISYLIGTHSVTHSICVILAWKKVHKRWPKPWELFCILIHDVGHIGLDYLDHKDEKDIHWKLGAWIARSLIGEKGYKLIAGHCSDGDGKSDLWLPDKVSRAISPIWLNIFDEIVEPKLKHPDMTRLESAIHFKQKVKENLRRKNPRSTHEIYLKEIVSKRKEFMD